MKEISTIQGQIWSIREIDKYPFMQEGCAFNYCFYDPKDGVVWAQRVVIGAVRTSWCYMPQRKETMDISIPWEWNDDQVPTGLLAAIVVGIKI